MALSGPLLAPIELKALVSYVQLFRVAAEVGRASKFDGLAPIDRWTPFAPQRVAQKLPSRIQSVLTRFAWHQIGTPTAANSIAADLLPLFGEVQIDLTQAELQGAMLAGAYFLQVPEEPIFSDQNALVALETLSAFVNGYLQSLPPRFSPDEEDDPDARNKRFRSYQRRHFGQEVSVRTPKGIIAMLPEATLEAIDLYESQLLHSEQAAHLVAARLAIALGRPIDDVAVAQIEITLATGAIWRYLKGFASGSKSHPMLGAPFEDEEAPLWSAAMRRIAAGIQLVSNPTVPSAEPTLITTKARYSIGDVIVEGESLAALGVLNDYVSTLSTWLHMGAAEEIDVAQRLNAFDSLYRRSTHADGIVGSIIISELPSAAMKVVSHANALTSREQSLGPLAEELAIALGDIKAHKQALLTLETASAWLQGRVSRIEKFTTKPQLRTPQTVDVRPTVSAETFLLARPREAESLLDLGAAISELVRFSQSFTKDGQPPTGWWKKFHSRGIDEGQYHSAHELMSRLPDGSIRLLRQFGQLLANEEHAGDAVLAARNLASTLHRDAEEVSVKTMAIGLAAGVVWDDFDRFSRGRITDTLLGVDPTKPADRLLCGRAHAQLEWGLQELLHTDSIPGV